jgi:hypothetical protein
MAVILIFTNGASKSSSKALHITRSPSSKVCWDAGYRPLVETAAHKRVFMSPCMAKILRMRKVCKKNWNVFRKIGVHAISFPIEDGFVPLMFLMTWVSAEDPRAQATSLMVGALHWIQMP